MGERNPFHMQEIGKKQIVHKICDGFKKKKKAPIQSRIPKFEPYNLLMSLVTTMSDVSLCGFFNLKM